MVMCEEKNTVFSDLKLNYFLLKTVFKCLSRLYANMMLNYGTIREKRDGGLELDMLHTSIINS